MLKLLFIFFTFTLSFNQASACVLQVLSNSEDKVFIRFEQTAEKQCSPKQFIEFHNLLPAEARSGFILKIQEIMSKRTGDVEVHKLSNSEIKNAILIDLKQKSDLTSENETNEFRSVFKTNYNQFSPCLKLGFSKGYIEKCDELNSYKNFWSKELVAKLVNNGFGAVEINFKNKVSVDDFKNNWDVVFHYKSNTNINTAKERLLYVNKVVNNFERYKTAILEEWLHSAEANQRFHLSINRVFNEIDETIVNAKQTLAEMNKAAAELRLNSSNLLSTEFEVTKSERIENDLKSEIEQYARGIIPYNKRKQIIEQYLSEIQSNNPFKRVDNLLSMYDLYHTGGFDNSVVKEENGTILSMLLNSEGVIASISHNSELINQYKFKTDAKSPIGILIRKNINRSLIMPIEVRDIVLKDVLIADQIYTRDSKTFGYNNAKRLLNRAEDYFNYYSKNLNVSNTYLLIQSKDSYHFFNTKVSSETFKGHELVKVGNLLAQTSLSLNNKFFDFLAKSYFNSAYHTKQSELDKLYILTDKMWDLIYFSHGMISGVGSSLYDQAKGIVEFVWHPIDSVSTLGSAIFNLYNLSSNIPSAFNFAIIGGEKYLQVSNQLTHFNELSKDEQGKIIGHISAEISSFIIGPTLLIKPLELANFSKAITFSSEIIASTGKYIGSGSQDLRFFDKFIKSAEKLDLKNVDEVADFAKIAEISADKKTDLMSININQYVEAVRLGAGPKLSDSHLVNFKNGKYFNRQLKQDEIFYRYHGENNRTGKKFVYLTKTLYSNEESMRNGIAILDEWGSITERSKINIPAGSWISEGLAAPQRGILSSEVRLGGDYQALLTIPDIPVSWIINTTKGF